MLTLTKGSGSISEYASSDYPTLSDDWSGVAKIYATYPGTVNFQKALTRSGNVLLLSLSAGDVATLADGDYTLETTITNTVLGIELTSVEAVKVVTETLLADYVKLHITLAKSDGTPAGGWKTELINTTTGLTQRTYWQGAKITVNNPVPDVIGTVVIDTEPLTFYTDAAGYGEIFVRENTTLTVSAAEFGTINVVVGTTDIDLSTLIA